MQAKHTEPVRVSPQNTAVQVTSVQGCFIAELCLFFCSFFEASALAAATAEDVVVFGLSVHTEDVPEGDSIIRGTTVRVDTVTVLIIVSRQNLFLATVLEKFNANSLCSSQSSQLRR